MEPEPQYDVFISYRWTEPDMSWVREQLAPALKRAGLRVCLDVTDFIPGRDVLDEMARAGRQSRHALCVLTPAYLEEARAAGFEARMARRKDPGGEISSLVPLLLCPTRFPDWLYGLVLVDWTNPRDRPREWRKLLEVLEAPDTDAPPPGGSDQPTLRPPAAEPARRPGFGSREEIFGGHASLPGQVFAIELLTQPLILARGRGDRICLTLKRDNVTRGLYTTEAKSELCQEVFKDRERLEEAQELDREIHRFLCGQAQRDHLELRLERFPLRWASGGVLSVVRWRDRLWTPFFFRDIPPYGWNIALGASEKGDDLNDPWSFLLREFLEETLVLDTAPRVGAPAKVKRFVFDRLSAETEIRRAASFASEHIAARYENDQLLIQEMKPELSGSCFDLRSHIAVDIVNTHTDVQIVERGDTHLHRNVLVCINLLELGIEIIKTVEYRLEEDDYILDGEILDLGTRKELLRMPMVMIAHDYLRKAFASGFVDIHYQGRIQPSIEAPPIPPGDIYLFPFDVVRRRQIAQGEVRGSEWERLRYGQWLRRFGGHFSDYDDQGCLRNATSLFTPASVKAMCYLFANCRGGFEP